MEQIAIPKHLSEGLVSVILAETRKAGVKANVQELLMPSGDVAGLWVVIQGGEGRGENQNDKA